MFRHMFDELIKLGTYTKSYLVARVNQIKSYNDGNITLLSTDEANYIISQINSSNLPD